MRTSTFLIAILAVAAVTGHARPAAADLVHYHVLPETTDPGIRAADAKGRKAEHQIYMPAKGEGNGRLLVYFPGSGGEPEGATAIYETAARRGYHVIGLVYVNDHSIDEMCKQDVSCPGKVLHENLDGKDRTPVLQVDRANSIENRLVKLLSWLEHNHPEGKWGRYLTAKHNLRWRLIAAMGHSQGGATAAYIGKVRKLGRVAMLSAPSAGFVDATGKVHSATWVKGSFRTDHQRYFLFASTKDPRYPRIEADSAAIGVPGPLTSVDGAKPPYGRSHRLTTSVDAKNPHNSVLEAAFAPVWRTLIGGKVRRGPDRIAKAGPHGKPAGQAPAGQAPAGPA
ncbi:MAG TPA: hypothetical protein VF516_10885, partial [Kofleriaceae bacterium]